MEDKITYSKNETELFTNILKDIIYKDVVYQLLEKEDTLPADELELLDVLDVSRYNKGQLQLKIIDFVA